MTSNYSNPSDTFNSSFVSNILENSNTDLYLPQYRSLLQEILNNKMIDSDYLLYKAIGNAKTEKDLLSISLALRSGANPNAYVNIDNIGTGHILMYVYEIFKNKNQYNNNNPVLSSIVIMLIVYGSRPVLPAFDTKGGTIRKENDTHYNTLSTQEWLDNNGYSNIIPQLTSSNDVTEINYDCIDPKFRNYLAALLDKPSMVSEQFSPKFEHIIKWESDSLSEKCFEEIDVQKRYDGLRISIQNINSKAVQKYISMGRVPNYVEMNEILVSLTKSKELLSKLENLSLDNTSHFSSLSAVFSTSIDILQMSISAGGRLDLYQYNMLKLLSPTDAISINKLYSKPYWGKICSIPNINNNDDISPELKYLAYTLDLDPFATKSNICSSVSRLAKANPSELKAAAIKKQMLRIGTSVSTTDDFMAKTSNRGALLCRNRALLDSNPYEYNDMDLSYYKDDSDVLWCFTSDMFESLLKNKKNPYTEQPLSSEYIKMLKSQRNSLKRLGFEVGYNNIIDGSSPKTFSDGLNKLNTPDEINNIETNRIRDAFLHTASINGINSEQINNISRDTIFTVFESVGIYESQIKDLSLDHTRITFFRISVQLLKLKPEYIQTFFRTVYNNT